MNSAFSVELFGKAEKFENCAKNIGLYSIAGSHPHNKKSSIKNNNVFKTKPTSGVTVVSAWLDVVKAINKINDIINFETFI